MEKCTPQYAYCPPPGYQVGKDAEVNWNDELLSRLRDKLRRLQRETKRCRKNVTLLRESIALVCLQLGLI